MKKFVTIMLVLALAGTMGTTAAFAAPDDPTGSTNAANAATVLIKARATFGGQIAMNDEGGEPVFKPDYPMDNAGSNVAVGNTVAFSAKADEEYKFLYWLNEDSGETYSTDATITIEASEALNLVAAFDRNVERVLIVANAGQGGQIAMDEQGGEPEFDPEYPMYNGGGNIAVGDTVAFSAKADEGYKFVFWYDEDAADIYSTDETIYVTAEKALNLTALFDLDVERVLITANATQGGQIAMNDEGGEPEFDPDYPKYSGGGNIAVGDTVAFSAKADEGWKFLGWMNEDTEELYSTDATIYVTAEKALNLVAVFDEDVEKVLIKANTQGLGQIAMNEEGDEPEFDPEYPMTSAFANVKPGNTVVFAAKADEGWKFVNWKNAANGEILSTEETFAVTVDKDMEIVAVFEMIENNNNDGEKKDNSGSKNTPANNNTTPSNGTSTPTTGDATSAAALAAVTVGSLGAAVMLGKKRKADEE